MDNHLEFNSLHEFASFLKATPRAKGAGNASTSTSKSQSWDLGIGLDGALDMALEGRSWEEGVTQMVKGIAHAEALRKPNAIPALSHGVTGFRPDVPEYLAGNPECMIGYADEQMPAAKPVVSICNTIYSAACTAEGMVNRGVALMSLVDALEADGQRCEVYWEYQIAGAPGDTSFKVCIKQASEAWTPASAAFAIAHPAMGRRLGFAFFEKFKSANNATNGGYGGLGKYYRDSSQYTLAMDYSKGDGPYRTLKGALQAVEKLARDQGLDVTLVDGT